MKTTHFLLVAVALAFFACSNDPQNEPDNGGTLKPNETADISSQVYLMKKEQTDQWKQCNKDKNCILNLINTPYTSNGVIKNIVHDLREDMDEKVIDIVEVGAISNGKIDLKFYTPKEEHLNESGYQVYYDLKLYDDANNPIGSLYLMNLEDLDNQITGLYVYWSEDHKDEDTWNFVQKFKHIFIHDIDVKKGWNLIYESDKYDYENGEEVLFTLTKTNKPYILNGRKIKMVFA